MPLPFRVATLEKQTGPTPRFGSEVKMHHTTQPRRHERCLLYEERPFGQSRPAPAAAPRMA